MGGLELDRHVTRAGQAVAYMAVNIPIAILAVPAVIVVVLGAALSVIGLGLPLLIAGAAACRWLLRIDRRAANRFLSTQIPSLPGPMPTTGGPWRRSRDMLADRGLWRVVAAVGVRPLLIPVLIVVGLAPVVLLAELISLGAQAIGGFGTIDALGPWHFGPAVGVVLCLFALPTAVLAIATLDSLRALLCMITRGLLVPRASAGGPVREMLAASLGDHSVRIAYWLPDREVFVDESGRRVELPEAGSGRAWTAVERDGRRVAAIVHDASLDTSSELVHAAAAASSLAIDNERLKADLRARVEELRVSRLRIVEAADDARRRIERDLHDGAQQQLVSLALELRVLRARVRDTDEAELVDRLSARLAEALDELRELARGIHPAALTDHGLGPALSALSERIPLEVEIELDIDGRLPAPVEAAAYFVVAEALTNVVKYAGAGEAHVRLHREGGELRVLVVDSGAGGARIGAGSGLRGLQDRVAAVGGTLVVDSPVGSGTRLEARIPCDPEAPEPARRSEPADGDEVTEAVKA
jgi:signal transduction histidine kinase